MRLFSRHRLRGSAGRHRATSGRRGPVTMTRPRAFGAPTGHHPPHDPVSRPLHGGSAGMSVDSTGMAARLGIKPGMVVQELGWDEDADEDLRDAIIEVSGGEKVDEDTDEEAHVVLLWWRDGGGDHLDAHHARTN